MSTKEKLDRYGSELAKWQLRMDAHAKAPWNPKPIEPSMESCGLVDGLEVWAALKVRAQILRPQAHVA